MTRLASSSGLNDAPASDRYYRGKCCMQTREQDLVEVRRPVVEGTMERRRNCLGRKMVGQEDPLRSFGWGWTRFDVSS